MANGKAEIINNFDDLVLEDFQEVLEILSQNRRFYRLQLEFMKYMFEQLKSDTDTKVVSCFNPRCGIGKSTFIQILIRTCIMRRSPIGLIIVTDSIKRLEDYIDDSDFVSVDKEDGIKELYFRNKQNIAIMKSGDSFEEQFQNQLHKPILLMSTQRYFLLDETTLKSLQYFYRDQKKYLRSKIIFDEPPYFTQTVEINIKMLNDIDTALKDGLDDTVEEKEWLVGQYAAFSTRLQDTIKKLEATRDSNVVHLYWKDNNTDKMTTNDEKFFELLDCYKDKINKIDVNAYFHLLNLRQLQMEGGFFSSSKVRGGNKYIKNFYIMVENRKKFFLGGDIKSIVLDATCDINPVYDLEYTKIVPCNQFNVPLNMTITNVNVTTSRNILCRKTDKSKIAINAILDYLKQKESRNMRSMLIATYQDIVRLVKKEFSIVAYFGNMKGLNNYREFTEMAHIGLNRFSQMAYFFIYCASNRSAYEKAKSLSVEDSIKYFEKIFKDNELMNDIMYHSILADFEQNIFRLAIRNFDNNEHVHVWTFYNNSDNNNQFAPLSMMMKFRYIPLGVKFEDEEAPEGIKLNKIMERKPANGKKMTNAQKIISWCEKQESGKIFKIKELLQDTGLSYEVFKDTKKSNSTIKELFNKMQTDKRGYYCIC